jgi:FAD/FMN-containing dehydrogenase
MSKCLLLVLINSFFIANGYAELSCRCLPSQTCWPGEKDWSQLEGKLDGKLIKPQAYLVVCKKNPVGNACKETLTNLKNPFYIESNPSTTQTQGWLDAWSNQPSSFVVEAQDRNDVVAAVDFAHKHNLRLVIKGTGHDYLGRSNAPNSLLIWTHNMQDVTYMDSFVPYGCDKSVQGKPAFTVQAGTNWFKVYSEATSKRNLYVQGGGCTTVGAAGGFIQGGGFGQYSRKYGTGAASILQAEVVTADGKTLIANQCMNKDLYFAIRGGGGGTFGVVTQLTLQAHPLPSHFGLVQGKIAANSDDAYKKLIKKYLLFYRDKLMNEHWGEQVAFSDKNAIDISMLSQGLNKVQIKKVWQPMHEWVRQHATDYSIKMNVLMIPPQKMWNVDFWLKNRPDLVTINKAKGAKKGEYWWTPDAGQVSWYIYNYESWWLPQRVFSDSAIKKTSETIFNASRIWRVSFHNNKALAGASIDAIKRGKKTSVHPGVGDAATLVIMSAHAKDVYPGVKGKEVDEKAGKKAAKRVHQAIELFMQLAPEGGAYHNEASYFQKNWQKAFWGSNYDRLYKIKQKYDPLGLFYCHHCVGSELWETGGMCPKEKQSATNTN